MAYTTMEYEKYKCTVLLSAHACPGETSHIPIIKHVTCYTFAKLTADLTKDEVNDFIEKLFGRFAFTEAYHVLWNYTVAKVLQSVHCSLVLTTERPKMSWSDFLEMIQLQEELQIKMLNDFKNDKRGVQ